MDEDSYAEFSLPSKSPAPSMAPETGAGQDTPDSVFNVTKSILNEELVKHMGATFLFVAGGKNPGKLWRTYRAWACIVDPG